MKSCMASCWEIWCKALGQKAFEDDKRADKVAIVRTVPQIFIEQHDDIFENKRVRKRTYIGGYTELKKHLGV